MKLVESDSFDKILIRGATASIGVAILWVGLIAINLTQLASINPVIARTMILLIYVIEIILLLLIYSSFKKIEKEPLIVKDQRKLSTFTKGYIAYVGLTAVFNITSITAVLLLSILSDPQLTNILLYINQVMSLLSIIPIIIYLLIWVLMAFMSKSNFNLNKELEKFLLLTSVLMILVVVTVFPLTLVSDLFKISAFIVQAMFFIKLSDYLTKLVKTKQITDKRLTPTRRKKFKRRR
ncbi:MAG: hypothetical protein ACTSQY_07105 [Candidatus Odinarchaeia archaeon]